MKLEHVRAFAVSNGISLLSIVPTLRLLGGKPTLLQCYFACLFRLTFVAAVLDYFTRGKRAHKDTGKDGVQFLRPIATGLLFVTSPLEAVMLKYGLEHFTTTTPRTNAPSWLLFIPHTFCLEVLFDFGHYCAHRLVHSHPTLYRVSGHKTHHAVQHPTAFSTYHQELLDSLLSNVLPFFFALQVLKRVLRIQLSPEQFALALGLKTYVEVAGHVGVLDGRATSFPQCVWLPRVLGIALHTRDHDLHHTHGGRNNFAKRFTLFDKLFGTYQENE